jgi:hypothetical protein
MRPPKPKVLGYNPSASIAQISISGSWRLCESGKSSCGKNHSKDCSNLIAETGMCSRSMKGRPLSGGCREKTLNNHINVDALIQKGACK